MSSAGGQRPTRSQEEHPAPSGQEFALLEEMGTIIVDAAKVLDATLRDRIPTDVARQVIRDLEHKGDAVAREMFELLTLPRATALDKDALKALTGYLDDIIDAIEAAAARLAIYRVRRVIPAAREFGTIILESAQELTRALRLRRMRDVFPHTRALHRLENRGDDVLRDGIEALFASRTAPKEVIKWKDILEVLEASTDRCEDVANVLEAMLVQTGGEDRLMAGRLMVDVERHEATAQGEIIPLSAKEFHLLRLLLRHQSKVVRRERLMHEVWGEDYFGNTRTLDTHIGWLRKKVEEKGAVRIVAVRGIGYRLDLRE